MILTVAAMDGEIQSFREEFEVSSESIICGIPVSIGSLPGGLEAACAAVGSGKVNASVHTALLLAELKPDYLFGIGIAAGISAGMHLGQLVEVAESIQSDLNIGRFSMSRGEINGPLPRVLRGAELTCCAQVRAATADRFVSPEFVKQNRWLIDELHADICDMESYCMAAAAHAAGIPAAVFRVISDTMEGEHPKNFRKFLAEASSALSEAVIAAVSHISE